MSLKLVAVLLGAAGVLGILIGYYLRLIISLGKKGSMELEIKEMLLTAKEDAKKITAEAQEKADVLIEQSRQDIKVLYPRRFNNKMDCLPSARFASNSFASLLLIAPVTPSFCSFFISTTTTSGSSAPPYLSVKL